MKDIFKILEPRDEKAKVLSEPFNVEVHAKTFVNYCEVIIWPDGKIEYAVQVTMKY